MSDRDCESEVKCTFAKFVVLCDEAKALHDSLMGLLHGVELERQQTWFKAKIMINNEFINDVQKWFTRAFNNGDKIDDKNRSSQVENNDKDENEVIDDVLPEDSVSKVASKHSSRQSAGSRKSSSSTASARIKAGAEKAALIARAVRGSIYWRNTSNSYGDKENSLS